jgi:uncharacterized phage protein (TIGR01671 family)
MREIKFRAWNKETKSMRIVDNMQLDNSKVNLVFMENGELAPESFLRENLILLQFTGLKDEDGKEIYEGDIVQKGFEKYQIEWQYTSFGINTRNYGWQLLDEFTDLKIIGNIYENPELLSQSKPVV